MSDSFSSQLLREIEDELHKPEEDESDLIDVKYEIIPGLRDGSAVMWAYEQKQIYYRNSYSADKHSDIRYLNKFKTKVITLSLSDIFNFFHMKGTLAT